MASRTSHLRSLTLSLFHSLSTSSRWGKTAHIVFLCFCFLTNIIVTAMLLLGGSAVVNALTGLNIYLASFLIPLGVIVYTLAGGLKVRYQLIHSLRFSFWHRLYLLLPLAEKLHLPVLHLTCSWAIPQSLFPSLSCLSSHFSFPLSPLPPPFQATFLASYIHSVVVHVILCIFIFLVYTASPDLGSPYAVYTKLQYAASSTRDCSVVNPGQPCGPVSGNYGGSYLTMLSIEGFIFGVINIIGNFGTVFVDNVSQALLSSSFPPFPSTP